MITTALDVIGALLLIAAFAVFVSVLVGGAFAVPIGLVTGGVLVFFTSWLIVRNGGDGS